MTGALGTVACTFCGASVHPENPLVIRRVEGWERQRSQGGTNAIIARHPLNEWACPNCARKVQRGLHPNQGGLW